ncbi:hypothetical protein ACH3XW_26360 [Acanthocheilonema viteae]
MTGRNRLLSAGKVLDGGNAIDVNVVEQESSSTEVSANRSLKSFPSSISSDFSIETGTTLNMSSIAIAEKDDPGKFRIYRPISCGQSESLIYYRCSKCESLEKKNSGGVRSKRYKPYVKTLDGKLIGNAHPEHHPNCHAVTKKIQELQEMDRACRAKIRASHLSSRPPQKLEEHIVEQSSNICVQSNYNLRKRPKRSSINFHALNRNINGSERSEVDQLLRFIIETCIGDIAETNYTSIYSIDTSLSNSIGYSSLIVPEPDGMLVRIYDGDGKLADENVSYYYCSRCDDLYQKRDNDSVRTVLKAENDLVVDYPAHHAECLPTSLESLRELGDHLKDFCVVANHRIIPLKAESECNKFHEPDESFHTRASDQQNWDTTDMDEGILINSTSVSKPQEQRCFCRRLYEGNVELYQEMLRSVDEMRSLVSEMKRISGVDVQYYIEDGQALEESENSTLYVVDE